MNQTGLLRLSVAILGLGSYCLSGASPTAAFADPNRCTAGASCGLICSNTRDCSAPVDNRSCQKRIALPFDQQIVLFEDPVCEAAKSAQNQIYSAQKSACETSKSDEQLRCEEKRRECFAVASTCTSTAKKPGSSRIDQANILWVDDNPGNNIIQRMSLEQLGAKIQLAESTSEAIQKMGDRRFDVIISDFMRRDDSRGGMTLLAEVRKLKQPPPYIIFSSTSTPEFTATARKAGALGETNNSSELFDLIIKALNERRQ